MGRHDRQRVREPDRQLSGPQLRRSWDQRVPRGRAGKNKLSPFIQRLPSGEFRVVRAGAALREQEVDRALTQVNPSTLVLTKHYILAGTQATYRLVREIGRGAVGHVWEAVATAGGPLVAVKVLNPRPDLVEPTRFANVRQRFRREIANGSKLQHQHVVAHLDHGEISGEPFLVRSRTCRPLRPHGSLRAARCCISAACCRSLQRFASSTCHSRRRQLQELVERRLR